MSETIKQVALAIGCTNANWCLNDEYAPDKCEECLDRARAAIEAYELAIKRKTNNDAAT